MTSFRRVYLYLASAISLQVVTWAAIALLRNVVRAGGPAVREAAAFQVAIIVVALPIFLAHWLVAQRRVAADQAEARSLSRRVYLLGMLAIWLVPLLANLHGLLARAIGAAISSPWATGPDLPGTTVWHPLTAILVLSVLGAYHGRLLAAEGAWHEEGGPLATARRVFLLFFTAMGTLLTAAAALQLLVMTLNGAVTPAALDVGLRPALPGVVARLAVGLLAWLTAGWALQRQYRRGWIGERQSALRPLYLHGFAVISMLATLGTAGILLAGALQRIMGLPVMGTGIQQIAVLVVGACGWLYHTQVLSEDAAAEALGARQRGLARLRRYVVAGVALSAALVAVAALIQVVIRAGMHAGAAEALRSQLAFGVAFLAVALPPWAVTWSQAQRAAALEGDQGAVERQSASRKLYLYFFLLMATVVVLSGAVYVVYRALAGVMAIAGGPDVPSQLAEAVAYALLGAALWAFHARIIRDDERQAQAERRARAATFQAVVLDPGGWPPGAAIARSLSEELIGSSVAHLDLHAGQAPGAPSPRDLAAAADLVIAPWPAPEAEAALRDLLEAAGGRRLLVAREVPGWSWLGTDPPDRDEAVRQAVHAARQILDGEPLSAARQWTPLHVIGALVLGFLILTIFVVPVVRFVIGGGLMQFVAP